MCHLSLDAAALVPAVFQTITPHPTPGSSLLQEDPSAAHVTAVSKMGLAAASPATLTWPRVPPH